MANVLVENQSLTDIANAIRSKLGVQSTYKPGEMAAAISGIPSGGTGILVGTNEPSASIGNNGDVYLQYFDGVPSGYLPSEYIQSSRNQYIDLGVKGKTETDIEVTFAIVTPVSDYNALFGAYRANINDSFCVQINSNTKVSYQRGTNIYQDVNYTMNLGIPYILRTYRNELYMNEQKTHTLGFYEVSTPVNLYLSAVNNNGRVDRFAPASRIYKVKLWENGELIRYMVPCVRASDFIAGLWDAVGETFYSSETSTQYTAGPTAAFTNEILFAKLKKSGAWQNLIGSDISDVNT